MSHSVNAATANSLLASIVLAPVKLNSRGGKKIDILDKSTGKPLHVYLNEFMTWGAIPQEYEGQLKCNLSYAFPLNATEDSKNTIDNFNALDNFVKSEAMRNCKEWFNKAPALMPMVVIDSQFTPSLKYSKTESGEMNMAKPPGLKAKIDIWNGVINAEVYQFDGKLIFPSANTPIESVLPKGCYVTSLLQCNGIWFIGGKFGISWKLKQACVQPSLTRGICVIHDRPRAETRAEPRLEIKMETKEDTTVADSDDERDPDQEYTGAEEVPVKGRKKVKKVSA